MSMANKGMVSGSNEVPLRQQPITNELLVFTSISGNIINISGQSINISGNVVLISGQILNTSISGNVVQISGQSINISGQNISTTEFPFQAAIGVLPGITTDDRVGHSNVITTTRMLLSNVTSAARPFNFPAAPMQMQVVSSSASDTAIGIGTQEVEIIYLTSPASIQPFKKKTEFIIMNGLTPVNTVATDIYRVDYFRVSRTGTNMQSVGDISLQSVGGAILYEQIDASYNVNRSAIHWVEKGYMTVVTDMDFAVNTAAGVRFTVSHTDEPNGYAVRHAAIGLELGDTVIGQSFNTPIVTSNPHGLEHYVCFLVSGKAANQVAAGTIKFIDLPL